MTEQFTMKHLESDGPSYPWHKVAKPICPRCSGFIPNNENPGAYPGAVSRVDNETEICSACGVAEAFKDFATAYPDSPIPPKWFDPTAAGERWDDDY